MGEKPNGTGVLEVTLGMRVNLNVYGPDGKPVAYNKCELWAEVKAADSATARAELDAQVATMMGDYAKSFGPVASESPLVQKNPIQRAGEEYDKKSFATWSEAQKVFAGAFSESFKGICKPEPSNEPYDSWRFRAEKTVGNEKFDAFRKAYAENLKKS
jgi:hypothetical protein